MNNQNKFGFQPDISKLDTYLKENEQNATAGTGPTWWSIPSGMSSVRILPPWDATGRVALTVYSHPIEFQGKGMKYKKYSWTCVNRTFGKPCNICQGLESIKELGVDVSNYEATRRTFYFNAIVMYDPDFDKDFKLGKKPENCAGVAPGTHVLMRAPKTVYDWVVANITNPMVGDITSITNGIDILITKEGSGLGTTYTTTLSPNGRQPVPQEYLDKIENLYNLDEIFSTGFEQEQIDELVTSLRTSSSAMNAGIPNMSQQMSGYPQSQMRQPNYSAPNQFTPYQQSFPNNSVPNIGVPQASPYNPMTTGSPTPVQTPSITGNPSVPPFDVNSTQISSMQGNEQIKSDTPDCFGKGYNASDVRCVTCAHEIPCSQKCKG